MAKAQKVFADLDKLDGEARRRRAAPSAADDELYAAAFRLSPDPLSLNGLRTGRFIEVNESFLWASGYTEADLLGRTPADLGLWAEPEAHADFLRLLRARQTIRALQVVFRTKAGTLFTGSLSAEVVPTEGEKCVLTVIRDVTEASLSARLKSALFSISETASRAEDLPDLVSALHRIVGELMPARNLYVALRSGDHLEFPYFVNERDTLSQVPLGARSLTEYVLRTGQPLLASPEVFADLAARDEVRLVGHRALDWLGAPLTVAGQTFGVLAVQTYDEGARYTNKDCELLTFVCQHVAAAMERQRATDALRRSEEEARSLNAELEQRVEDRTAELLNANRRLAATSLQLSEANADLARADRLKDEFLASMSHELRTPLSAILGLSDAMREELQGPLTDRQRRSLETVGDSGRHLLALINDVLDLSKIGAGHLRLDYSPVDVAALCRTSLALVLPAAKLKDQTVAVHIGADVGPVVADERRLKQMLVNLLSNAVKFTPERGTIGLDVAVQGDVLRLEVWDTGIGISTDDLPRLFQPFVQLQGGLDRSHPGTGLGLALVARLVRAHGGSIGVESEPGRGSRFTLSLPWRSISAKEARALAGGVVGAPDTASRLDPDASAPLILVAEGEGLGVPSVADQLEAQGYRLERVREAEDAVRAVPTLRPAVIVVDLQLDGIGGLEAVRRIRETGAAVPIVAVTSRAMPADRERSLAHGADAYFAKPIGSRDLVRSIEELLVRARGAGPVNKGGHG